MNLSKYPLWTAMVTPLKNDGMIDFLVLDQLIKEQESAGNGILFLGSTGEALNLDDEEKKEIIKHVFSKNITVPTMVGVGGINLKQTLEWINFLNNYPINTYLLVTPIYSRPGPEGQFQWFETLLNASVKPCVFYNIPSRSGVEISHKALSRLLDHKNFFGIKEASGSLEEFKAIKELANDKIIYSGDDALLPDLIPIGARGLISVISNIWPVETRRFIELCLTGELSSSQKQIWVQASKSLFLASNPIPVKRLLFQLGKISSQEVRPPLSAKETWDFSRLNLIQHQFHRAFPILASPNRPQNLGI